MTNTSLTTKDLFSLVKDIHQLIAISANHRVELYEANQITLEKSRNIYGFESRLSDLANELINSAIQSIKTDLDDAASVLQKTTGDLNAVIKQLNNFNNFIGTLGNLVSIFSRITQAAAGGTTAIISSIVGEIQKLTSSSSSSTRGISENTIDKSVTDDSNYVAGNINEI